MATSANNSVDVPRMTLRSGKTVYENDDRAHVTVGPCINSQS